MAKKNQKKRNSFKKLLVVATVLLVIAAAAFVVFNITGPNGPMQQSALQAERKRIESENADAELEFNAKAAMWYNSTAPADDEPKIEEEHQVWTASAGGSEWKVEDLRNAGLENTTTISLSRSELINGGLLLVNAWHSLPSDFSEEGLLSVGSTSGFKIQVEDAGVKLFPAAYSALEEALNAAKEAGLEHYIVREGYRSVAAQEELFNARMSKLSSKYSGTQLMDATKKEVNYPGTSDYHSGMSFRMDVYEKGNNELNNQKFQAQSAQGAWLTENCWKYGIIFRFPGVDFPNADWEDKSFKTGVSSQINLYRYVGKAHSAVMKTMNMCLEEYIEFLIDHPHICVYQDGKLKYEIVRIKGTGGTETFALPVPNMAASYQASLDNMDGIVMAYTFE